MEDRRRQGALSPSGGPITTTLSTIPQHRPHPPRPAPRPLRPGLCGPPASSGLLSAPPALQTTWVTPVQEAQV